MPLDAPLPSDLARYARQVRFAPLGEEGQRQLMKGRALLCGCGATFIPKRVKQMFYSPACRYRYYNARRKAPEKVCPHCGKAI